MREIPVNGAVLTQHEFGVCISFDATEMLQHGDGRFSLLAERNGDNIPHEACIRVVGNTVLWNITPFDTQYIGGMWCKLTYTTADGVYAQTHLINVEKPEENSEQPQIDLSEYAKKNELITSETELTEEQQKQVRINLGLPYQVLAEKTILEKAVHNNEHISFEEKPIFAGQEYDVTINGITHHMTAIRNPMLGAKPEDVVIGNIYIPTSVGEDSGEDFCICWAWASDEILINLRGELISVGGELIDSVSMKITSQEVTYSNKLPAECLSDDVATVEWVKKYIDSVVES